MDALAFVYTGAIRLVLVESISEFDIIAISYTWTTGIKHWRDHICKTEGRTYEERILRGSRKLSTSIIPAGTSDNHAITEAQLFFTTVAFFALARGKKFFWIDILCINQDEEKEKEFFVPRMGYLYRSASETHAYPFGAEVLSTVFDDKVYFPVWDTRAWTVQEHILSQNVIFCYAFLGDVREELKKMDDSTFGDSIIGSGPGCTIDVYTPVLNKYWFVGVYMRGKSYTVLETPRGTVTCYMRQESWVGDDLSFKVYMHAEISVQGDWSQVNRSIARSSRNKALYAARNASKTNLPETARISMVAVAERRATVEEDMIYCVLGPLNLDGFPIAYKIGVKEAMLRVFEAIEPKILAHVIGTDWVSRSHTNNKDSALPRVIDSSPVLGILSLRSSILHCKYNREVGTKLTCRREKLRIWKAVDFKIRGGQDLVQSLFGNNRLLLMQGASVFDTPEYTSVRREDIPNHDTKVIIVDMRTLGVNLDDETSEIDRVIEFVEVGVCAETLAIIADLPELATKTSLLTLCCEEMASGALINKGTALILDASALSTEYCDIVIE